MTELQELVEAARAEWREAWRAGPQRLRAEGPVAGEAALNLELQDETGASRRLSEFWESASALILFWRHFGCGCGVGRAERLRAEYDDYVSLGAQVVVVGQGEPARARAYKEEHGVPCPILCDPDRAAYTAYGLPEGQPEQVVYAGSDELLRRDYDAGIAFADMRAEQGPPLVDSPWQMPGEFVVAPGGTIRLAYRYQWCEDYPDPRVLRSAIKLAG
jgi:peroxiredoxin